MTRSFRAYLIDLDGTMVDSKRDIAASLRRALALVAPERPAPAPESIYPMIGKPLPILIGKLGYALEPVRLDRMQEEYRTHYAEHCMDTTTVYPGVPETLRTLKRRARLGVVTTKRPDQARMLLEKTGLLKYFDHVQGLPENAKPKPDPELLFRTLAALGSDPAEGLMIGDTEEDIKAGQAAGTATCAALYGFRAPGLLRALAPDYEIEAMPQLLERLKIGADGS